MTVTILAGKLAYDHIDSRVSWTNPDPEALIEQSTPFGTLDCVSHSEGMTVLGVNFIEPADRSTTGYQTTLLDGQRVVITSDDCWLDPRTIITIYPDDLPGDAAESVRSFPARDDGASPLTSSGAARRTVRSG